MINLAAWIIGGICLLILIVGFASRNFRNFLKSHNPVFNLVATIVTLTAFIQIYISVVQFKHTQVAAKQEERQRFNARMATLVSEILGNLQVCDYILKGKDDALLAKVLPQTTFEYDMLQDMFRSGEFTKHTIRGSLLSIYHRMLLANQLIEVSIDLVNQKTLANPSQYPMINERLSQNMVALLSSVREIKTRLESLQSDFKEFWDDPEKYKDSVYLKGY